MTVIDEKFMEELREKKTGLACPICGHTMTKGTWHAPEVHHRMKRSHGRYDVPEVCVVICHDCNCIKVEMWSREKFVEAFGQHKYDYFVKGTDIDEEALKIQYPDKVERRVYAKQKIGSGEKMPYGKDSVWKRKLNGQVVLRKK